MGQVRGRTAKLDACNLRSLSSFGVPAAGQHILVSTDNSAMQNGQGNFDAYVVGDGTKAATELPLMKITDAIPTKIDDNAIYVTDNNGYIVLQITSNGVEGVGIGEQNWLKGKNIYSLGDSLATAGVWQKFVAQKNGAEFDESVNYQNLSYGGTATYGGENSGQDRAKKLVTLARNGAKVDVVFLENINDMNKVSASEPVSLEGEAIMRGGETDVNTGASTYSGAVTYFRNNINTILSNVTPEEGHVVNLKYNSGQSTINVKITGAAQSNGDITLVVGGVSYNIAVTTGMSISDIVAKILEYSFEGYTDTEGVDGESVDFIVDSETGTTSVTFSAGSTGVTATLTSSGGTIKNVAYMYNSLNMAGFTTFSNWGEAWVVESLARVYKGFIEYLQRELPSAVLIWIIPTRYQYNFLSPTTRGDGTIDMDAYISSDASKKYKNLVSFQRAMCERYGIPFIDLTEKSGISLINAYPTFYNNNNVHPTNAGYTRWGDVISEKLTGK